jgi:hypothetical protein
MGGQQKDFISDIVFFNIRTEFLEGAPKSSTAFFTVRPLSIHHLSFSRSYLCTAELYLVEDSSKCCRWLGIAALHFQRQNLS